MVKRERGATGRLPTIALTSSSATRVHFLAKDRLELRWNTLHKLHALLNSTGKALYRGNLLLKTPCEMMTRTHFCSVLVTYCAFVAKRPSASFDDQRVSETHTVHSPTLKTTWTL